MPKRGAGLNLYFAVYRDFCGSGQFFTRVLHLVKDPQGRCFLPNLRTV
jgi:hypothetical protein